MIKKSDLSLRIGIGMLLLCAAFILIVLPAAANYSADKPLVTNATGSITGDMNYTIGNSSYSPKMWSNDSYVYTVMIPDTSIPGDAEDLKGRLYVYWTWSFNDTNPSSGAYDTGVAPSMNVKFGDTNYNTPDASYVDWKDDSAKETTSVSYNYPSGTYAYDVSSDLRGGPYEVEVTNTYGSAYNQSFNIQAVGLLTLYNQDGGNNKDYWIDEGCDLTNVGKFDCTNATADTGTWSITPDQAVALANFTNVDKSGASSAKLITCAPAAGTPYNRLYVNYFFNYPTWQNIRYWNGLWTGHLLEDGVTVDGNFSSAETDVYDNLIDDETNYVGFQNGLYSMVPLGASEGQMQAANAFLLLNKTA